MSDDLQEIVEAAKAYAEQDYHAAVEEQGDVLRREAILQNLDSLSERISQMLAREKQLEAEVASWKRKTEEATQAHTNLTETYSQVARRGEQLEAVVKAAREPRMVPSMAGTTFPECRLCERAIQRGHTEDCPLAALDAAPLQGEKEEE